MEKPKEDSGQIMPFHHAALFTALAQEAQALMTENDQIAHPVDDETVTIEESLQKRAKRTCPDCGKSVASNRFTEHTYTHTGEKPYKCDLCYYSCTQKSNLTRHKRNHTNEKSFKCEICDFSCTRKDSLSMHMRTHTVEKPFKCSHCNYSSTQSGHVTRHMSIHNRGDAESKLFKKI